MTAKTPVTVVASKCELREGTIIATFSGNGTSYVGQHGLWNTSNCMFAYWTTLDLSLTDQTATAKLGTGAVFILTRVPTNPPAGVNGFWWAFIVLLLALIVATITYLILRRTDQGRRVVRTR